MIVLHATVGSAASALDWLCNPQTAHPENRVSSHYLVNKTGTIYQLVNNEDAAWHAGRANWHGITDVNAVSVSIELENRNDGRDPYPPAQLSSCRDLCKSLVTRYHIARGDVVRHLDIAMPKGRKTDPASFPDWDAFVGSMFTDAPREAHAYVCLGLPIYEQSTRTGKLYGFLLPGAAVEIDDLTNGHLRDGRGFVDIAGLVKQPV
jgi:N-acetyl-anhydromuramyl-L-alanine amidase AmpD